MPGNPYRWQLPTQVLFRGAVVEYIQDIDNLEAAYLQSLRANIENPNFLDSAPRNSCIVTIVTGGIGKKTGNVLCYPFFPPHISMPVKPGEWVWLVCEQSKFSPSTLPYWMARVPANKTVDDSNFTHGDRHYQTTVRLTDVQREAAESGDLPSILPKFYNGDGTLQGASIKPIVGQLGQVEDSYSNIIYNSLAYRNFTPEAVPKFTKRPGDLVLQGSNNTLICLGQDRGWPEETTWSLVNKSNAFVAPGGGTRPGINYGTIDIVSGRGRLQSDATTTDSAVRETPEGTACRRIFNMRGEIENDKMPVVNAIPPNNRYEGDPDYKNDASRLYVSSFTEGDKNFGIGIYPDQITGEGEDARRSTGNIAAPFVSGSIENKRAAYNIFKSDEIRLIARKAEIPVGADGPPNGSIRLIKEGTPDGDNATVTLCPDGTIQISGSRIFIGRSILDGGTADGPDPEAPPDGLLEILPGNKPQPWVKYQQLEDLLTELMNNLKSFCSSVHPQPSVGYGNPLTSIQTACDTLSSDLDARIEEIPNLKSTRIFGE